MRERERQDEGERGIEIGCRGPATAVFMHSMMIVNVDVLER